VAAIANHVCSTPNNRHVRLERILLIGSNAAAQANATNAITSKGRIISVIYPYFRRLHVRGWEVPSENGRAPTSALPAIGRSPDVGDAFVRMYFD
jgi:hypothetical protein